jgi:hypothetical protein
VVETCTCSDRSEPRPGERAGSSPSSSRDPRPSSPSDPSRADPTTLGSKRAASEADLHGEPGAVECTNSVWPMGAKPCHSARWHYCRRNRSLDPAAFGSRDSLDRAPRARTLDARLGRRAKPPAYAGASRLGGKEGHNGFCSYRPTCCSLVRLRRRDSSRGVKLRMPWRWLKAFDRVKTLRSSIVWSERRHRPRHWSRVSERGLGQTVFKEGRVEPQR